MDISKVRTDALIIRLARAGVTNVLHTYYEAMCDGDPLELQQLFAEPLRLIDIHDELNRRMVIAIKGKSKIVLSPAPMTPLEIKLQEVVVEKSKPKLKPKSKANDWNAGDELPL